MCIPGMLPAGAAAHVACFRGGCAAAAAADAAFCASTAPAGDGAPPPEPLEHCTVVLGSVQHCEAALAAALALMADCVRRSPALAADAGCASALSLAAELMQFGGPGAVQPAAVAAAATLAAALPVAQLPAASLLQALVAVLDDAAADGRLADGDENAKEAARPWHLHLLQLAQRCLHALALWGGLAEAAPRLADVFCRAVIAASPQSRLQAELAHMLADLVTAFPDLADHCGCCVAALPAGGAVAAALVRLVRVAASLPAFVAAKAALAQTQQVRQRDLMTQARVPASLPASVLCFLAGVHANDNLALHGMHHSSCCKNCVDKSRTSECDNPRTFTVCRKTLRPSKGTAPRPASAGGCGTTAHGRRRARESSQPRQPAMSQQPRGLALLQTYCRCSNAALNVMENAAGVHQVGIWVGLRGQH